MLAVGRDAEERADRAGDAPLLADDFAFVIRMHAQLQDDCARHSPFLHLDRVGVVHQRAGDVEDQLPLVSLTPQRRPPPLRWVPAGW